MIKILLAVLLSAVFTSTGQVFFKTASNQVPKPQSKKFRSYFQYIQSILASRLIWCGFFSMSAGLILWLAAIAQGDLSLVYPLGSLYYIFVLILARAFLGEKIDAMKIFGTAFILIGMAFIVSS